MGANNGSGPCTRLRLFLEVGTGTPENQVNALRRSSVTFAISGLALLLYSVTELLTGVTFLSPQSAEALDRSERLHSL